MIAAIDSARLAAKDERAGGFAVQAQDPRFNSILQTAARRDPPKAVAQLERPVSPGEAQPRHVYGEAARPRPAPDKGEPRVARREEPQDETDQPQGAQEAQPGKAGKTASSASRASAGAKGKAGEGRVGEKDQDRDKALDDAQPQPPSADELAGALMQPALVLTAQDIIAQSNANSRAAAQRSIDVQLGTAAYRLSPHGQDEQAAAQAAGAALPPDYTQTLEEGTANNSRNVVREPAQKTAEQGKGEPVLVVDALAMVQLSKQAQAARDAAGAAPQRPTAPEGSALARTQTLNQLAANPAANPGAALSQAQAVQPVVKPLAAEQALPLKDTEVKAPDVTAASAAAGAAGTVTTRAADTVQPPVPPAPQHADPKLVDKVVHEARWMISNKRQEVTMRLEPEHLGNLKIHVTQKDGTLHVEMTVDNAAAKHLLDSSMSQLRERFQNENLAQGQMLHVDVRQGGTSEFAQQFAHPGGEQASGLAGRATGVVEEPVSHPAPRAAWSNSNVSIYA